MTGNKYSDIQSINSYIGHQNNQQCDQTEILLESVKIQCEEVTRLQEIQSHFNSFCRSLISPDNTKKISYIYTYTRSVSPDDELNFKKHS